jgi:hypothetical protein
MDWQKFVQWAFEGLLAGTVIYGVSSVTNTLKAMQSSIEKLNSQMAIIIERDVWHTKWLEKHDEEIREIRERSL